jgi:hypothetical protein
MTFDTSYYSPPRSAATSTSNLPLRSVSSFQPPLVSPAERAMTLQRPELKSSNTLPATLPAMDLDLDHNAWADEDEEFGKEREIEMTFA